MSKTKRLEKEIDYLKFIMTSIIAIIVSIFGWFISGKLVGEDLLLKIVGLALVSILIYAIIAIHKKIKFLLEELEATND